MSWKYEYPEDLDNEKKIIARVEELWGCGSEKMSGFAYSDFILTRGTIDGVPQGKAFCEIRVRSNPRNDFDTIFITLNKYKNMLLMSEFTDLPAFFVVQWSDECAYTKLTRQNEGTSYPKRRNPKGDDHNDEPCVHLSVNRFERLWKGKA